MIQDITGKPTLFNGLKCGVSCFALDTTERVAGWGIAYVSVPYFDASYFGVPCERLYECMHVCVYACVRVYVYVFVYIDVPAGVFLLGLAIPVDVDRGRPVAY